MDFGLSGQVALVTGGSKGIGKACARALLAEGARVALLARDEEALAAARAELVGEVGGEVRGEVITVSADTSSQEQVDAAVAAVVTAYGRLDVVVNAAATPASSTGAGPGLAGASEADILTQVDTKALGYLRVVRAAVPHLRAAGGGRIVNISGMNARWTGAIGGSVRNIAVVAIAKNLADELGRDNIAVTVVHPGLTATDSRVFSPALQAASETNALGRTVRAEEVADVVAFLASPRAVALNGAVLTADGSTVGSLWA
jgi:NAD(P)-dependent dehydrogenase (short-subunit alcohol dehydrogenase family)